MTICMRTRDPVTGKLIVRETDFLTRFLFAVEIPWNDRDVHTYSHDGLTSGTPFYHIRQCGIGSYNAITYSNISYLASHFDISFRGNIVTVQQIWNAEYINRYPGPDYIYEDAHSKITIIFGVY
ncbi:hypothetical protein [Acinetobacter nosocomialis]|uniref:hypothetical protein n=1 Tax=Acinetobacter nosocomialis TaxID=106654 RepID=UPI0026EC543B|nr:hypothetical protein [Acinetobacter nosocomialis]MDO7217697.1 hypothetical protein [Acinetobacter nosocomialis]